MATSKRKLSYIFSDDELRVRALTHRSANSLHNERLEFLGDALLGMLVAERLFKNFPMADEGQLTRARAALVNGETLAEIAREIDLGSQLILGEGELKSGGWRRDSILANALESLLGAIYLDGGIDACRNVIAELFETHFAENNPEHSTKDAKTELQEFLQSRRRELPRYETTGINGPSHEQTFTVSCTIDILGAPVLAAGRSRRKAEQAAASAALDLLKASSK